MESQGQLVLTRIEHELGAQPLQKTLNQIVKSTALLFPNCGGVSLVLWDSEDGSFSVSASTVANQPVQTTATRVRSQGGATRWIVDNGKPLVVADVRSDPFSANGMLDEYRFQAYAGVPMVSGDNVLGVLYALYHHPHTYKDEELSFLTAAAHLGAVAISKTQLLADALQIATIDELTGLYRRQFFDMLAEREIVLASRLGHALSAIMFDIDHFKAINDSYGHLAGDEVLRVVAQRCKKCLRSVDVLGRYGGEEFIVVLPGATTAQAAEIAERMRHSLEQTGILSTNQLIYITISLGIATFDENLNTLSALIDGADQALYAAKQTGRNRLCIFQPEAR